MSEHAASEPPADGHAPSERVELWVEDRFVEFAAERDQRGVVDTAVFLAQSREVAADALTSVEVDVAIATLESRLVAYERARDALAGAEPRGLPRSLPDFEIESELGQGGMGRVYRARQRSLDRCVAIKVPLFPAALGERERVRLRREADAIARLEHPGIVRLHALIEHDGVPLLVMELVDGGSLADLLDALRSGERVSLSARIAQPDLSRAAAACAIAQRLLDALDYAHSHGVVHRDLKPSNVMVDRAGGIRLLDFGLARLDGEASVTRSGDIVGTPQYLAPELVDDRRLVGPWTDVYGVGVLLYELLTLRQPFGSGTSAAVIARIRAGDAIPVRAGNRELSTDLAAIIEKAIAREPDDRYHSARDFADDLQRFSVGDPVAARPVSQATRWLRRIRRRPDLAAALTAVVVLLVGLASFAMQTAHARQAEHESRVRGSLRRARSFFAASQWRRAADALAASDSLIASPRTATADRETYARMLQDLEIVRRLDGLKQVVGNSDLERLDQRYAELFAGLGLVDADAIQSHALAQHLIVGLDEWVRVLARRGDDAATELARVRALVNAADDNERRVRIREAFLANDREALAAIVNSDELLDLSAPAIEALSASLEQVGEAEFAERVYRLGPVLHPDDYWMHHDLADYIEREKKSDEMRVAVQAMRSALLLRPNDPHTLTRLAGLFTHVEESELALRTAQRVIDLDPDNARAHYAMGIGYMQSGRTDEAVAAYQRMFDCATEPTLKARALAQAGATLENVGRSEEAVPYLERAIELDPRVIANYIALAFVFVARLGEDSRAKELLQSALEREPGSLSARHLLTHILEKRGEFAEALALYRHLETEDAEYFSNSHAFLLGAASTAANVASGRVPGGEDFSESQRHEVQRLAIGWLSQSLDVAVGRIAGGSSFPGTRDWLADWPYMDELVALREDVFIDRMAPEHAAACRELWQRYPVAMRMSHRPIMEAR